MVSYFLVSIYISVVNYIIYCCFYFLEIIFYLPEMVLFLPFFGVVKLYGIDLIVLCYIDSSWLYDGFSAYTV